jgi:hypothetical protein
MFMYLTGFDFDFWKIEFDRIQRERSKEGIRRNAKMRKIFRVKK